MQAELPGDSVLEQDEESGPGTNRSPVMACSAEPSKRRPGAVEDQPPAKRPQLAAPGDPEGDGFVSDLMATALRGLRSSDGGAAPCGVASSEISGFAGPAPAVDAPAWQAPDMSGVLAGQLSPSAGNSLGGGGTAKRQVVGPASGPASGAGVSAARGMAESTAHAGKAATGGSAVPAVGTLVAPGDAAVRHQQRAAGFQPQQAQQAERH
jgi:hypothetical protein